MRRAVLLIMVAAAPLPSRSAAGQEVAQGAEAIDDGGPRASIGAELVYTYSLAFDRETSRDTGGALVFNRFGLTAQGSYRRLSFFGRYMWQSFGDYVRVGYIGYRFAPWLEAQVGIPVQPFGVRPSLTSGFISGVGYVLGMEDDSDAGAILALTGGGWDVRVGYFPSDEFAGSSPIRWGGDIVRGDVDGDGVEEGIGSEANQGNLRVLYAFDHPGGRTEVGVSGRAGRQVNRATGASGSHMAAAAHVDAAVDDVHFKGMAVLFDHETESDADGAARDIVPYAALGSVYAVAAEGTLLQGNLSWGQAAALGPFDRLSIYNDFTAVLKRLEGSRATFMDVAGVGLTGRYVYVYFELLLLRNHPLFDSTLAEGLARGTTDSWSRILNTTFGFQF